MKYLIILLLLPSIALAADKQVYVIAGCANNGNGTANSCAGSPGGVGAYNTCAAMVTGEVAANADLTATGMNGHLLVSFSNTGGTKDTTACNVNGFATDTTHKPKLTGNWTGGAYSTSYYMIETANSGAPTTGSLTISDNDVEIDRFQIINTGTGTGGYSGLQAATGAIRGQVTNSLIRMGACNIGGGGFCVGLWWNPSVANCKIIAANNISYAATAAPVSANYNVDCGGGGNNGANVILFNNVADRGNDGFQGNSSGSSDLLDLENNIAQNNATNGYDADLGSGTWTTTTRNTNLSMDTSSPNNTWDSKTVTFADVGNYHLAASEPSSGARDSGTDLSANGNYAFSTDFEGTSRPINLVWDMGAHEAAIAATYDKAWNPRATTTYCTDPADTTYYLGPNGSGDDDTYPMTRNTSTFGGTANIADNRRDRDATGGCNLAGSTFQENNTTAAEFRVLLPSTGQYDIHVAMGRANGTEAQQYFEIFDNTTSLTSCFDAATASGAFVDATCVERSSKANWASNEVAYRGTFATTTFFLKYGCNNVAGNCGGSTAGNSNIAYVRIVSVDAGTPTFTVFQAIGAL